MPAIFKALYSLPTLPDNAQPMLVNTVFSAKVPFQLIKFSKQPPSTGAIIGATPFTAFTIARNLVRTGPLHVDFANEFRKKFFRWQVLDKAKKNFIYGHEISLRIMVQRETQTSGFCAFFIAQGPQQKRLKWTFT